MKILNGYAGIGGNRKLWENADVTAVEINPKIAEIYKSFFPNDNVVIGDAHKYLLQHYKEFDFIWLSPPCTTHSDMHRINLKAKTMYPDMKLYQEIIFLQHYFKGKYCVENVIGFYEPLIKPQELQRHYFWANFPILKRKFPTEKTCSINDRERLGNLFGFGNLEGFNGVDKRRCLRNCVLPELGLHILNCAIGKVMTLEHHLTVVQKVNDKEKTNMSGCEYEQEGFCIVQDAEGVKSPCPLMDKNRHCTAKPEDLTEYCADCLEPLEDCGCGATWVLAKDSKGNIVPITPKDYKTLRSEPVKGEKRK